MARTSNRVFVDLYCIVQVTIQDAARGLIKCGRFRGFILYPDDNDSQCCPRLD